MCVFAYVQIDIVMHNVVKHMEYSTCALLHLPSQYEFVYKYK